MHLIKVNHIGLQTPQRILGLFHDPCPAGIAKRRAVVPIKADLRGDHDTVPPAGLRQCLAEDFFGAPKAIDGRRVEKSDATIEGFVDRPDRLRLIGSAPHPSPDRPCAEADARYGERRTGDFDEFHLRVAGFGWFDHNWFLSNCGSLLPA